MPVQVLGEDGRELHENLHESDAHDLAARVHAATGETLTLIPYVLKKGEYVLDKAAATLFPAEGDAVDPADLSKLTVKELDALAAEHGVEFDAKAKKQDKVAALESALA